MTSVERHKTAMHRMALSKPIALALGEGLINGQSSVFDYGCGRGGDVQRLRGLGIEAAGWDPAFSPDAALVAADIVNLGYVVNVIERRDERASSLRSAWRLARQLMVVAARLDWEERSLVGRPHNDGLLTTKGTFQKFFAPEELRDWLEATLHVRPVAAAPGIYYLFRNAEDSQRYLASRLRRRIAVPRPLVSEALYEAHRPLFDDLATFVAARGRVPREEELSSSADIRRHLGSIPRALAVLRRVTGAEQWRRISEERLRDLLVYLALANFGSRPRFSDLSPDLQYDVRDFFGSYRAAVKEADGLLFAAGNRENLDVCMRSAGVGKLTPEALYVHTSTVPKLPPLLRVYEGCGRALTGTVEDANILKLHRHKPQVSYLAYPSFDSDAHPALATVLIARLAKLDVTFRDFRNSNNPPVLHRKETFVDAEYPGRAKFERLTRREEALGLLDEPLQIGTRDGWTATLRRHRVRVRGHRLHSASAAEEA